MTDLITIDDLTTLARIGGRRAADSYMQHFGWDAQEATAPAEAFQSWFGTLSLEYVALVATTPAIYTAFVSAWADGIANLTPRGRRLYSSSAARR